MSVAPPRPDPPRHDRPRPTRRPLAVAVRGKGVGQALGRAVTVGGRYGVTPARMLRRLDRLATVLDRYDATATLPITAAAVGRHPRVLDPYVARGIEFAVHGLHHVDHVGVDPAQQLAEVQRACDVLASSGVAVTGFRAPYLRCDDATLAAVRSAGLAYDASPAVHWPLPDTLVTDTYRRGLAFYGATAARDRPVLPWVEDGLVRIPYSLPDDESLVERLRLDPARIAQVWVAMFEQAHAAGALLTVSLHPERIGPCAAGIAAVLDAACARGSAVWVTTLGDVARWWLARTRASVVVEDLGRDGVRVRLRGRADLALVGRGVALPGGRARPDGTATTTAREVVLPVGTRYVDDGAADAGRDPGRDRAPRVWLGRWPGGARSALVVTGDVDALTVGDFAWRLAGR